MDEPRRGTRKRFLAPDTYLDMLPLEPGPGCPDTTVDGGRKRAGSCRGRKGGLGNGGGKKNLSAPGELGCTDASMTNGSYGDLY